MDIQYCRRCGKPATFKNPGMYVCPNGHTLFYKATPATAICLVNEKGQVLLGTRGIEPNKGMLDMPGGFCEVGESCEEALVRELREELGLEPGDYTAPQFLCTGIDHYPYEGEIHDVMGVTFWAYIKPGAVVKPGDDVAHATFYTLENIKEDELSLTLTWESLTKLKDILKTASKR